MTARALDEQQKNLLNIISGNFEISKQQIANQQIKTNHKSYILIKVARVEENLGHLRVA